MIAMALGGLGVVVGLALGTDRSTMAARSARDAIFGDLRDGLFVLDTEDRVVELNRTGERILGRSAQSVVGQPAVAVFAGELRALLGPLAANESGGANDATTEIELGDPSSRRVYELRLIPLADESDTPLGR